MVALKKDLGDALATIGRPPTLEFHPQSVETAEAELDAAILAYRRHLMTWRVDVIEIISTLEAALKEERVVGGDNALRQSLRDVIAPINAAVNSAVHRAERAATISPEDKANLDLASAADPALAKIADAATKNFLWAVQSFCDVLYDIRDRVEALEWDYDPDARGGPVYENADDLLASLDG